jgi:uncharacterized protein
MVEHVDELTTSTRPCPLPSVMSLIRCAICGKMFDSESSRFMPFCSERCKRIDLGRWLGERYGLPYEAPEEETELPKEES